MKGTQEITPLTIFFQFLSSLMLFGFFTAPHKQTTPWYFRINHVFAAASNYELEKKQTNKQNEQNLTKIKFCDRQVLPRQRKHIVLITSGGKRHDKVHEQKVT